MPIEKKHEVAPEHHLHAKPLHKHGHRFILAYIAILLLAVGCGGIYTWQHDKVIKLDTQIRQLNAHVANLKTLVDKIQKEVATTTKTSGSSKSTSSSTSSNTPSACTNSELGLSLSQPNGTAGTIYADAILTNLSSTTCTLEGVPPKVTLTTSSGSVLGTATGSGTGTTITLTPETAAHATVGFPLDNGEQCTGPASYLELTLPGQTAPLKVADTNQYCTGFSVQAITNGS